MKHAVEMWKNTRMIVLVAVCAAIYAAALIVFKTAIPLVPGITEVRVAGIFPMTFGILFGPAGAWGLALGNVIGDVFGGTLGPSSIAGFFGNFLLAYIPYTMWLTLIPFAEKTYEWRTKSPRSWMVYFAINLISSAACAVVISVVVDILGIVPYAVLSKIITLNDFIGGAIGVALLMAVNGVVRGQMGLLWMDVMGVKPPTPSVKRVCAAWLVALSALAGVAVGFIPSIPGATLGWVSCGLIILGGLLL